MRRKPKWKSTTLWITLWAMASITYMIVDHSPVAWMGGVATMLGAIVVTYVGGNKAIDVKHGPEMREPDNKQGEP